MATKRFTDAEKWKDPFFEELTPEFKLIYLYLLDDCDNAGIWNKSLKRLNYSCGTNITEKELMDTFSGRLISVNPDTCIIPKFMDFQYGKDWISSGNKAVVSARKKLSSLGIDYESSTDTLSIPYGYPIDRVKDKDKDKDLDKEKDKSKDQEKEKVLINNIINNKGLQDFSVLFEDLE